MTIFAQYRYQTTNHSGAELQEKLPLSVTASGKKNGQPEIARLNTAPSAAALR